MLLHAEYSLGLREPRICGRGLRYTQQNSDFSPSINLFSEFSDSTGKIFFFAPTMLSQRDSRGYAGRRATSTRRRKVSTRSLF
jgi:hypothetical protein